MVSASFPAQLDKLDGLINTENVSWSDVLIAVGIFIAALVIAEILGRIIRRRLARPGTRPEQLVSFVSRTVRWLVIFVGAAWSLSLVGVSVAWLTLVIAVVVIVAVLFARPLVESLAAGFVLMTRHGFGVGDQVHVDDLDGEILEITSYSTVLRLRDGRRVHMPNTDFVSKTIIVYTTEHQRRSTVELEIDEQSDVEVAERCILDALVDVDTIAKEPSPSVRARGFADGVQLSVRFWHQSDLSSGATAQDHAVRTLKRALENARIGMAFRRIEVQPVPGLDQPESDVPRTDPPR